MNAVITNIQGFSIHDGPGIRTVVFLKGCPLRCKWCANPEGIAPQPQVGYIKTLCKGCFKCVKACPEKAIVPVFESYRIDRECCTNCGKCVEACAYNALVLYGAQKSASEVFDAVRRDKMFYETSGGGVTVSGGEPLLQKDFVHELFTLCRENGIDTCVETCGFVPEQNLLDILPLANHLLFDLKHMDTALHQEYTGQPNDVILKNALLASDSGADLLFRLPLIPGVNDTASNIDATAAFIKSLPNQHSLQLMPYHRMGDGKYQALNQEYLMRTVNVMTPEAVEAVRAAYEKHGVHCTISK